MSYLWMFRNNWKMYGGRLFDTKEEAEQDLRSFFEDSVIEYTDGTRRRSPMHHGFYCVVTEERYQEFRNPEGSWCSVTPAKDEIVVVYYGPNPEGWIRAEYEHIGLRDKLFPKSTFLEKSTTRETRLQKR